MDKISANPNQVLWEKGDFTRIAAAMRGSGEDLVKRIGVGKGQWVLDLGCGDGTTAVPAAQAGANVLGIDIARNLVAAGNRRVAGLNLANCRFQHGDASDMRAIPDHTFDMVVSIFGAMFCPKPLEVAKEMVRVTRPGGRVIMGNWIPGDPTFVAQLFRISSAYLPPPPEGFISPMTWGIEKSVTERFVSAGIPADRISFTRESFIFRFDGSPQEFVDAFRRYYGPTMNAFESAGKTGRAENLRAELEELFISQSTGSDKTTMAATFLLVSAAC